MSKLGFFLGSCGLGLGLLMLAPACAPEGPEVSDETSADQDEALKPGAQFCGGFANLQCPSGYTCVDDPTDGCNPAKGGADCGGYCKKAAPKGNACKDPNRQYVATSPEECQLVKFFCAEGTPFFDDCGCGCDTSTATATPCGTSTCGAGQYCCNASCGICAPEGGVCTQQVCEPI